MPLVECPCCHGSGFYEYEDFRGRIHPRICTACKGSCVLYLTPQRYARRIREMKVFAELRKYKHWHEWSSEEIAIVAEMKTVRQTVGDLATAGFRRSEESIKQRRRQIRREMCENTSSAM